MTRCRCAVAIAAIVLALSSCSRNSSEVPEQQQAFSRFADQYFDSYFLFNPSDATAAGIHKWDHKLENRQASHVEQRITELKSQAVRLNEIRRTSLTVDDAIDAQILSDRIAAELLNLETLRVWRRNPLFYASMPGQAVDLLMKRNFASPKERLRLATERINQAPALMEAMTDNARDVPQEFAQLAVRTLRGSISFFRDVLPGWAKQAAEEDSLLVANFTTANRNLVTAMEVAAQFLEKNLLPLANGVYAIGADDFLKKLRLEEGIEIPLARLREIGEANLERDYRAFLDLARRSGAASPQEAMRSLASEHPSEAGLIEAARSTSERIRAFVVSRNIIPIPSEIRPAIEPTPAFMRAFGFAFMDTPGAFETQGREAFYYITPTETAWTPQHKEEHLRLFNRPVMDMITIHEAWPGHYVQFLYASQFPTKTRKLVSCGSNAEGWAHYTEQMMVEQGFGEGDPKVKLAQLAEALVRDVRYLAGIRLHTEGWTVDEAKRLFMERAFLDEANARQEALRGTYNPTYLYYTLGKLMIYKLRQDVEAKNGSAFSLGEFHRGFVKQGAIPIPHIRRIMLGENAGPAL